MDEKNFKVEMRKKDKVVVENKLDVGCVRMLVFKHSFTSGFLSHPEEMLFLMISFYYRHECKKIQ